MSLEQVHDVAKVVVISQLSHDESVVFLSLLLSRAIGSVVTKKSMRVVDGTSGKSYPRLSCECVLSLFSSKKICVDATCDTLDEWKAKEQRQGTIFRTPPQGQGREKDCQLSVNWLSTSTDITGGAVKSKLTLLPNEWCCSKQHWCKLQWWKCRSMHTDSSLRWDS